MKFHVRRKDKKSQVDSGEGTKSSEQQAETKSKSMESINLHALDTKDQNTYESSSNKSDSDVDSQDSNQYTKKQTREAEPAGKPNKIMAQSRFKRVAAGKVE